jgi:hypothetical protein
VQYYHFEIVFSIGSVQYICPFFFTALIALLNFLLSIFKIDPYFRKFLCKKLILFCLKTISLMVVFRECWFDEYFRLQFDREVLCFLWMLTQRVLKQFNKIYIDLPINQLRIALYMSPMSSSFYIFDEHDVSEFPYTGLNFRKQSSLYWYIMNHHITCITNTNSWIWSFWIPSQVFFLFQWVVWNPRY